MVQYGIQNRAYNVYIHTEMTIWTTVKEIYSADDSVNIGRPIADTQVYLIDDHLKIPKQHAAFAG